jgi:hypothetical protein
MIGTRFGYSIAGQIKIIMLRSTFLFITTFAFSLGNMSMASGNDNAPLPLFTEEEIQISVFQNTEDHRYIVCFKNETDNDVDLSLEDLEGHKIYTEKISGQGIYNKRFDLINLVDGQYKVTVSNDYKHYEKDLVIK